MKQLKLKKRILKTDPAILIAAFGTTASSGQIYAHIDSILGKLFHGKKIVWAFTSEIVREEKQTPGIYESLAVLESEGYRKIIVQPLHIFPATEYRILESLCDKFPGLRIVVGETLTHRWSYIEELFNIISTDFLTPDEGFNLVIGHGSPLAAEPANVIYSGMERYCRSMFSNVLFSTIDGMPSIPMMLKQIGELSIDAFNQNIRILPFMLTAGKHVKDDLLEGNDSLKETLKLRGYLVDYPTAVLGHSNIPKSLGFYDGVIQMFAQRIERSLELFKYY